MACRTLLLLACLLSALAGAFVAGVGQPDNGFGAELHWWSLDEAKAEAASTGKAIMVIVHKPWCGACRSTKSKFTGNTRAQAAAHGLVMVNSDGSDGFPEDEFKVDGGYVPRIFFLSPAGELMPNIFNDKGNPSYKYFYGDIAYLADTMERVAGMYPASAPASAPAPAPPASAPEHADL